jgi:hypothetical protein
VINTLLEILKPERAVDKEDESFKRGLDWLLQARPSDDDPINRSSPRVKAQASRRAQKATT